MQSDTHVRAHLFIPRRLYRPRFLKWLRRTHAWLGLWGAVLGLLFGATGFLLNHRSTLPIGAAQHEEKQRRLELPGRVPDDPQALVALLQRALKIEKPPLVLKVEPAKPAPWNEDIRQPERWQIDFYTANRTVNTEYWVGNRYVAVRTLEPNFFAWLTRLHMGTGASVGWILLVDTLAGGLIVLSVTGLLLWTRLHGPRLAALGLIGGCLTLALTYALMGS